jgi:hypothetical protein
MGVVQIVVVKPVVFALAVAKQVRVKHAVFAGAFARFDASLRIASCG